MTSNESTIYRRQTNAGVAHRVPDKSLSQNTHVQSRVPLLLTKINYSFETLQIFPQPRPHITPQRRPSSLPPDAVATPWSPLTPSDVLREHFLFSTRNYISNYNLHPIYVSIRPYPQGSSLNTQNGRRCGYSSRFLRINANKQRTHGAKLLELSNSKKKFSVLNLTHKGTPWCNMGSSTLNLQAPYQMCALMGTWMSEISVEMPGSLCPLAPALQRSFAVPSWSSFDYNA